MALRNARGQAKAGSACKNESILKSLQNSDLTGLSSSLKTYLSPLFGSSGRGKENDAKTELTKLAREFTPFLLQFLKLCGTRLASLPSSGDAAAGAAADELFSAMAIGLDGLGQLRIFLTGSSFEIELQRYGLVRRLMAWKRFGAALAQCQILFRSLCQLSSVARTGKAINKQTTTGKIAIAGGTRKKTTTGAPFPEEDEVLGPPNIEGKAEGLPPLIVAAVIDLIWCTAENAGGSAHCFDGIMHLPEQLAPWISLLDAGNAVKQRDALFRALYKCTLVVVAQPAEYGTNLLQLLCKLTLDLCASSSQCNQYGKVARKFCTSLSSKDGDESRTAVKICSTALSDISSKHELGEVRRSMEVLELVDWFSRSCQASHQIDYGWNGVYGLVCRGQQVSEDVPVAVAGLYGIGLFLMKLEAEQCVVTPAEVRHTNGSKENRHDSGGMNRGTIFLRDGSFLLSHVEEVLSSIVQLLCSAASENLKNEGNARKHLYDLLQEGDEFLGRLVLGIARALQYLQKPAARYVQNIWNEYVSDSHGEVFSPCGNINTQLRKLLKLCYPLVEKGTRCPRLSDNDRDVLGKSFQLASQMSVAALRLSLLHNSDVQDVSSLVMEGIQHLLPEEKLWLMSSTYNMGVQLFNAKQYSSACWPLELAYNAAWARINSALCKKKDDVPLSEMLSEACTKCSVFADARSRNGEHGESKFILIDGLTNWARVQPLAPKLQAPHALVKSFIKLVCVEMKSHTGSSSGGRACSSYGVLGCLEPPLPAETLGLLLEEELAVCKILREQFPEETRDLEAEIFSCLLERVYTRDTSLIQKSRILLEKSRGARLRDTSNLPTCIKDVSEALGLMEVAFNNAGYSTRSLNEICSLKMLLAVAYSMMAVYSYELNPLSQDFYVYAVQSFNTWSYLLKLAEDSGSLCEAESPQYTVEQGEEPLVLLLSLMDLLHIQGYSVLFIKVHELVLKVSAYLKQPVPKAELLCSVMNRSMSHLLCSVLFPSEILSHTRRFFDSSVKPLEYWQGNMALYSGSLMEAQHLAILENADCPCGAKKEKCTGMGDPESVEMIKRMANFTLLDAQKSSHTVLQSAGLRHIIAEHALQRGELSEAFKYANEAYRLRSKVFKRIFRGFEKRSTENVSADDPTCIQDSEILAQRDVPSSVTASSWPFTVKVQQLLRNPSQWRILGDYVESLKQVGVIYEAMGAADDAERCFREGLRIATAQNLPMVLGWFSSSLGEVYRKRLMWESAENQLNKAREAFERLDGSAYCKTCIITGKALLEMRIGDLVRHYWCYQQAQTSSSSTCSGLRFFLAENLTDAVSCYTVATVTLSGSSDGCNGISLGHESLSTSVSVTTTREMLSSLRAHGKKVSNNIMAAVKEAPCAVATRTRKPRLRRSVQTMDSIVINIGPDGSQGKDLEDLCEDMSLASLSAEDEKSTEIQRRKTRSLVKPVGDVAKGKIRNSRVDNKSAGQLLPVELPGRATTTKMSLKMKESVSHPTDEVDRMDINQVDEQERNTNKVLAPVELLSAEEWPNDLWNHHIRKLLARVFLQRGKCLFQLGQLNEAVEVYQKAMSTLYASCTSCLSEKATCSSAPVEEGAVLYHMSRLLLLMDQCGEPSRQGQRSSRRRCEDLEIHKLETVNRLYRAFNLCHQVPPILRKIAKLLAIIYVALPHGSPLLKPGLTFSGLQPAELAAYFHQISLGTTLRQQHLAALDSKVSEKYLNFQPSTPPCSSDCVYNMQRALRVIPLSADNLGGQVKEFLNSVPPLSVCCISFVDQADLNLVTSSWCSAETNPAPTVFLLVTRFTYQSAPVVILLPVGPLHTNKVDDIASSSGGSASNPYCISDDEETSSSEDDSSVTEVFQSSTKKSQRILEKVAAEFESVLEESRQSTSGTHPVSTSEEKSLWWKWRMQLDRRLEALVRTIEVSWLGHYKCLLLGEPREAARVKSFDTVANHIVDLLVSVGSVRGESANNSVNSGLVRSLLKGVGSYSDPELQGAIAEILGWKDRCHLGSHHADSDADFRKGQCKSVESVNDEKLQRLTQAFRAAFNGLYLACETDLTEILGVESSEGRSVRKQPKSKPGRKKRSIPEVISDKCIETVKLSDTPVKRQPLQLILDSEAQALPWESLPVVREHEVYRMPSLGNVHAIYIQHQFESMAGTQLSRDLKEPNGRKLASSKRRGPSGPVLNMAADQPLEVTFVNPCNTFYILNPSGDLKSTQMSFEHWFVHQPGWKGKAGTPPTAEEFKKGLQVFDLFVYLGHGTGDQFLPERFVRQLDQCAATLLMGCSSGRLSPRGQYEPFGTVLSYLMAGCPSVIANLWDVTDGDIDRFSKFLLHKWMSLDPESAGKDELNRATLDLGNCEQPMTGVSSGDEKFEREVMDVLHLTGKDLPKGDASETVRLSSAVGQSRKACRLPYLIGASPVCYGVPTGLRKQVLPAELCEIHRCIDSGSQ